MKSKLILVTTIAMLTLSPCLFADDVKHPPINPALLYWQSAAVMPDLKGEKAELLKDTISGKRPFDAAKAKEILSGSDQALKLFAKAAASSALCDWGLPLEEGPEMGLPHLSKVMELSRLAILKADALFAEGKPSEGGDWLLASHRSARHAGVGDLLITELVQTAIETSTINAAGLHCLGWDDATRTKYAEGLKALPPLHSFQDAFHGETLLIDWAERLLKSGDPKMIHELVMMANPRNKGTAADSEREKRAGEEIAKQFAGENGEKMIADWRDLYRRIQAALGKPWKECQSELELLQKEAQGSENILMTMSVPVYGSVSARQFELATRRTMLDAALQYGAKLDGAAAAAYKDSFDGKPLVLKKEADGSRTLATAKPYRNGKDIELKLGE